MPTYKAYVSWKMGGVMEVEASDEFEATKLFEEMPLPTDSHYLECSFEIEEVELIEE